MNQKDDQFNEEIRVKIKTLDNNILDIFIKQTQTIGDLKNLIEISSTIPASQQRLIYKGKHLNNEDTLLTHKIEDQCVVHLIANISEFESSPLNRGLSTSSIDEHENRNFDVQENRRNSRKRVLQQRLHGFQNLPARNSLQQNVMTLQNLLQSFNTVAEVIEQGQIFAQRDFEIGQWIDFKDSFGEWVEGFINQKQQNQVSIVHQNGEDWIQIPSNRLALFRSHTIQKTYHLSPIIQNCDQQQLWSFSELLGQTAMLLSRAGNMMSRLADSVEDKTIPQNKKADMSNLITGMIEEQRRIQEEKVEKQDDVTSLKSMKSMKSDKISIDYETSSIKSMKSDISKLTTYFSGHIHNNKMAENIAEEEEDSSQDMSVDNQRDAANISREFKENYAYYETALLAAQLAPLSDRLGRLLVDLSPYLALSGSNINNVFQNHPNNNVSNLSIITNEGSQYSTQAKQYYFQVPILLTPIELQTQQQNGASVNRIVSEQIDIINHLTNNNNSNRRKVGKKEEEEKQSLLQPTKIKSSQTQQYQQQQQQYHQIMQQQPSMLKEQQQKEDSEETQQVNQQYKSQKIPNDDQTKRKKKGKEVSFSEQINQLKKDKQF